MEPTIFKTPKGEFYGVSKRALNSGYTPPDGTVFATDSEVKTLRRAAAVLHGLEDPYPEEVEEEEVVKELPAKTPQNLPINFVIEEFKPKPIVLSPTEQKRQAFFETLPEEEISYYEGLSNQGLSAAQLYKIKVAKNSKTIRRKVN